MAMGQVIRFGRRYRTFSRVPHGPWRVRVSRRRRRRLAPWTPLLALVVAAGIASVSVESGYLHDGGIYRFATDGRYARPDGSDGVAVESESTRAGSNVAFRICGGRVWENCVIDGDTIRYYGMKIRLADIDTPEIFSPKCESEAALGHRAKERLRELLNGGSIEVVRTGRDKDRYGRDLRVITRDGRSLGDMLIAEGLARRWDGARRGWCT